MTNSYPYQLEKLPYDYGDLEPVIDKMTMEIHHDKHHQAYVDNLNKALADKPDLQKLNITELFGSDIPAVKNNAGGVWNHDFFWTIMTMPGYGHIEDKLLKEIEKYFESVDKFMEKFEAAALGRFGSGWAWLVKNKDGSLEIMSTANQDNPMTEGKKPLLALDVWEHAYYLKYQNRRAEYAKAWWNVVNWAKVEELLFEEQ